MNVFPNPDLIHKTTDNIFPNPDLINNPPPEEVKPPAPVPAPAPAPVPVSAAQQAQAAAIQQMNVCNQPLNPEWGPLILNKAP